MDLLSLDVRFFRRFERPNAQNLTPSGWLAGCNSMPRMLPPPLHYGDDDLDEGETGVLRFDGDDDPEDPMCETHLMPAKHGSKSPILSASGRPRVPSPFPHMSAVQPAAQHKVTPPPPAPPRSDPPLTFPESLEERAMYEPPSIRPQLYSISELTGSDVRAPIHRLDPGQASQALAPSRPMPTSDELAARRAPWAITGTTPPEFEPFALPMFQTPGSQARIVVLASTPPPTPAVAPRKGRGAAIAGLVLGVLCGLVGVAIAHGDLTAKDAHNAELRGKQIVAVIAARL